MIPWLCRQGVHFSRKLTFREICDLTDEDYDKATECRRCHTHPDDRRHGFVGASFYAKRWQYWTPRSTTSPWLPRVSTGSDEYCNPSVLVILPMLGALVVFYKPGPLRTEICADCRAEIEELEAWNES